MFSDSVEDLLEELTRVMLDASELNDPDSDSESEMTIEVSREDPEDLIDPPESPRELPQMLDASTQTPAVTVPIKFAAPSKTKYTKPPRVPAVKHMTSSSVTGKQKVTDEADQSQDSTHTTTGRGRSTSRPWLASSSPGPPAVNKTKGSTGLVDTSTSTAEKRQGATGKRQRQSSPQPCAKRQRRSRKSYRPLSPHLQPLCWNCHREDHRYSDCPEKIELGLATFCRRCRRRGVTLAECPTCRDQWERQGQHCPSAGRCVPREEFKWDYREKASENFHQREP
ncbi:uncharacterized protein LOC103578344 [Microplitis demolitor]|uniref:uncharacterized protein LOC103578344 n=1 Tax=Microplitis demolitor TaxID=69319 RepID=UPI00235B5CE0|nr:uncharacterized protein LOC103578344 [Microplitis demolitor]XP_053595796.1 uncharacterized protein LOC103578344 [Microplitis demolitor]